jgi:hypothetical protein
MSSRTKLRSINSFDDLLPYLEEELDWPLQQFGFDDLTFEYSPAELGLKDKDAVKVSRIHQLRPLQYGQPWGIFFVEFEKKKLPVVVLRRILSHLVIKKRASANRADAAAWRMGDLLFISAYGDAGLDRREIAFAHFHQEGNELPTLRVLGWDGGDTPLKLEHVAATLHEKLRWPDDISDHEMWRETWRQAFRHRMGHVIRTADALAEALAALARRIRGAALLLLEHETETGALRSLHKAFRTALIHDLSEADFADTYAQTITYGLLTAAISRTEMSDGAYGTALIAENIADIVPVTNPFLKEMLQTFLQVGGRKGGIDFDELGIQDVVELLRGDETDLPAILRDFGNKTQGEDPVIHFYEHFLAAYDKKLKVQRGVFYTPKPVVSYIVRSVHELLQSEFGLADGLADTTTWGEMAQSNPDLTIPEGTDPDSPFVVILDPATGTATFLVEVVDLIYRTLTAKWQKAGLTASQRRAAWNEYLPRHLLPRLYGYELMMAPYAIAHMKMGLKLYETGYRFGSQERVRIYLTNALERPDAQPKLAGILPALAHEAEAVNKVKQQNHFTVVMGNPPYSVHSSNQIEDDWIGLRDEYYMVDGQTLGERNPKVLLDDYVKFIRFGQQHIEQTAVGILAFITNHGYLDNPTFRGMRKSLLRTFDRIHLYDLHGNTRKKEAVPSGIRRDENVFDIMQGVSIGIFGKHLLVTEINEQTKVFHQDIWGARESKYRELSLLEKSNALQSVSPKAPFYLFNPQNTSEHIRIEYEQGWRVVDFMPQNSVNMRTHRDHFAIDFDRETLKRRIEDLRDKNLADEKIKERYNLKNTRDWSLSKARAALYKDDRYISRITKCHYRPLDVRWIFYSSYLLEFPATDVVGQFINPNIGFSTTRQTTSVGFEHVLAIQYVTEYKFVSHDRNTSSFPLYVYPSKKTLVDVSEWPLSSKARSPNLDRRFIEQFSQKLDLDFISEGCGDMVNTFGPEDVFFYTYSVFHSPAYRHRYAELLKTDFPRLPLTADFELFRSLIKLGSELVTLHLIKFALEDAPAAPAGWPRYPRTAHFEGDNRTIEKFPSAKNTWRDGRVAINRSSGFTGIPEEVWNFHIGGYQVCHKWLKDRKGRTLSDADIHHYCKIVTALHQTIRLMAEIDEVIEEHGGWPIQ